MLTSNVRDTNFFKNYLCEEWLLVNKKKKKVILIVGLDKNQ